MSSRNRPFRVFGRRRRHWDDRAVLPFGARLAPLRLVSPHPKANMADAFVDSMGINIHMSYGDTSYSNFAMVKQRLVESGLQRMRDYPVAGNVDKLNQQAAAGIKTSAVMGVAAQSPGSLPLWSGFTTT